MGLEFRLWFRALLTKHNLLTTLSACPLTNRGSYFYLEEKHFLVICINSIIIYHSTV